MFEFSPGPQGLECRWRAGKAGAGDTQPCSQPWRDDILRLGRPSRRLSYTGGFCYLHIVYHFGV
jgi:hypothetical protein